MTTFFGFICVIFSSSEVFALTPIDPDTKVKAYQVVVDGTVQVDVKCDLSKEVVDVIRMVFDGSYTGVEPDCKAGRREFVLVDLGESVELGQRLEESLKKANLRSATYAELIAYGMGNPGRPHGFVFTNYNWGGTMIGAKLRVLAVRKQ